MPFTGNPGVASHLNAESPVDFFLKLFDSSVLELIHRETLRYLDQFLEDLKEHLKARVHELARHPITLCFHCHPDWYGHMWLPDTQVNS